MKKYHRREVPTDVRVWREIWRAVFSQGESSRITSWPLTFCKEFACSLRAHVNFLQVSPTAYGMHVRLSGSSKLFLGVSVNGYVSLCVPVMNFLPAQGVSASYTVNGGHGYLRLLRPREKKEVKKMNGGKIFDLIPSFFHRVQVFQNYCIYTYI